MTSEERHEARYQRRKAERDRRNAERAAIYTQWDRSFGLVPLIGGYRNAAKASKDKTSTQIFMSNLTINARKEETKLACGRWKSPGFNEFTIKERGKWRTIQSAKIAEKGIQNSFVNNCFIPLIRPHLIFDNGASLKGMGTDFSLRRFEEHLRRHVLKHGLNGGIYFFDFSAFFANIQHKPLFAQVGRLMQNDRMMEMYVRISRAFGEFGLGLGSPVSQISAVFFPNRVDHFVKETLGMEGFGRHMDDGYIICEDLDRLKWIAGQFEERCRELGIIMNRKKCRIIKISKYFSFLKVRHFVTKTGMIVRRIARVTIKRERHRLRCFREFVDMHLMDFREAMLNFHSWLMSMHRGKSFHVKLNAVRYFNRVFEGIGRYFPPRQNRRKYRVAAYIACIA